jgi:hypothetical protein
VKQSRPRYSIARRRGATTPASRLAPLRSACMQHRMPRARRRSRGSQPAPHLERGAGAGAVWAATNHSPGAGGRRHVCAGARGFVAVGDISGSSCPRPLEPTDRLGPLLGPSVDWASPPMWTPLSRRPHRPLQRRETMSPLLGSRLFWSRSFLKFQSSPTNEGNRTANEP